MPDIANGREKVNAFLKEKGIKKTTLAVAYGFKRQEVTNILSGTTKGPRANSFILRVIEDYGIEQEDGMNELEWFYFAIIVNTIIGFATYYASKRDRKKRIDEYKKIQDDELEKIRNKFNL